MRDSSLPIFPRPNTLRAVVEAALAKPVALAGMKVIIPGTLPIRLSVVLSNLRMQRMLDALVQAGDTVIDVGANIGYNTLYAAHRVGSQGKVFAIEPAQDNLRLLYANLFYNELPNVTVLPYAAGASAEVKHFYLRGDVSAVNSLYRENFYHPVTQTVEVLAMPLDQLLPTQLLSTAPTLVKIDVEGAELEVLAGMTRILNQNRLSLIVEWHPALQEAADHAADTLPIFLMEQGFKVQAVSHTNTKPLGKADIPALSRRLLLQRSPVELLAIR